MKPTAIQTKTQKKLRDLAHKDGEAEVLIGGVEHFIELMDRGDYWLRAVKTRGRVTVDARAFDPNLPVTATKQRPMTVGDLKAGDCFVTADCLGGSAFCVCIDGSLTGYVKALRVCTESVRPVSMDFRCDEVTLVTPSFNAESTIKIRTVPIGKVDGRFELAGRSGEVCAISANGAWRDVAFDGTDRASFLPCGTPVTVCEGGEFWLLG